MSKKTLRKAFLAVACAFFWLMIPAETMAQYQTSAPAAAGAITENPVKKALKEGKVVIGGTVTAANADVASTLAGVGFDFLWIEMEHSPLTLETVRSMILATRGLKAMPFTRVPVNEPWMAKRVLDIGSLGVIFPFTSTRVLAEQAVKSCKYPPLGVRGYGPSLATSRWGLSGADYAKFANENVMVIVIIEQKQAIDNIEEIAAVPGIDVLFIGVNDLSYSLGMGGKTTDPIVEEAVSKVLAAGKKYNIPVGYPAGNPAEINKRIAQGFRFFQASSDLGLMTAGARDLLSKVPREEAGA
ncbi:MAG: aldolase/citrate lyase family protein, partial [Acidobacteria bacterium]|nr:aldolase/citrate lyase family protein [Acidobacteriota bacterium]